MTTLVQVALLLTLLVEPLLALAVDLRTHLRARRDAARAAARPAAGAREPAAVVRRATTADRTSAGRQGVTVVVPVTAPQDLERLGWLRRLGDRVLLVVAGGAPQGLVRDVWGLAATHGFRVHVAGARGPRAGQDADGRPPGRTRLLAEAHTVLSSDHVVCVDPGTVVAGPLEDLVTALVDGRLDLASPTVVVPGDGLGARVLRVEDALAARLRPWRVRTGAHVARRTVHADLLPRHTGFGHGDDLELGVLAVARRHRTGRVDVTAVVPEPRGRAWWVRRVTDAAGLFRLAALHPHLALRHPSLHLAGAAAAFALVPLLWWSVLHVPWVLAPVVVLHAALGALVTRDRAAGVHALYAVVRALVVLPLGAAVHLAHAARTGDAGTVRAHDPWWTPEPPDPVLRRLPGPARATDFWAPR